MLFDGDMEHQWEEGCIGCIGCLGRGYRLIKIKEVCVSRISRLLICLCWENRVGSSRLIHRVLFTVFLRCGVFLIVIIWALELATTPTISDGVFFMLRLFSNRVEDGVLVPVLIYLCLVHHGLMRHTLSTDNPMYAYLAHVTVKDIIHPFAKELNTTLI